VSDKLKLNVFARGYKTPTPIQDQAIEPLLSGRDVVGIANTGTGKTAAFLIPLIDKVSKNPNEKVLIVAPTRELAVQIESEFREFSKGMGIYSVLCIGGVGMRAQIQGIYRKHNFVIGTPGRLIDLDRQRNLNFGHYNSIVLDEVDCMLDMGFIHDVRLIISKLPKTRHSLCFSATIPDSVKKIMTEFVPNPLIITVVNKPAATNVNQDVLRLNGRNKTEVLNELLMDREFEKVLVFGRTKHGMEKLALELRQKGVMVEAIHGNKSQGQRQRAIEMFKQSRIQVLVATDLASRGLDIQNVTHVINYDLPENLENYIHRIGRTGRADKKGIALTFVA
jgi:superfamily II DNA/RNA helicase